MCVRGHRTLSKSADTNLEHAFVANALFNRSLIQQNRIDLVTRPDFLEGEDVIDEGKATRRSNTHLAHLQEKAFAKLPEKSFTR